LKSDALGIVIQPCDPAYMPKGPQGQKRPADVVGNAVLVMQIATGEVEDTPRDPALEYARKGGLKGGKSRAAKLTKKRRSEIARKAARARWSADSHKQKK
jgi:hypothetical protein